MLVKGLGGLRQGVDDHATDADGVGSGNDSQTRITHQRATHPAARVLSRAVVGASCFALRAYFPEKNLNLPNK